MNDIHKKELSETDICDLFITPAILKAGWEPGRQIRREVTLTPGPVIVRGNLSSRNKKKKKFADYVLYQEPGIPLAVVEAKDNRHSAGHGMQQALSYAEILAVPSAFSSNGDAFTSHNKVPAAHEEIESRLSLDQFPSPPTLWRRYKKFRGIEAESEKLVLQPYHTDSSGKEPHYYQVEAVNRVVEAIAQGRKRLLIVMATSTRKTYTTFQIIWRLWKGRMVTGGAMLSGTFRGKGVQAHHINEFYPLWKEGKLTDSEFKDLEEQVCPTCGACCTMGTANTMCCMTEALGMSLPNNGAEIAVSASLHRLAKSAGRKVMELINRDIRPRNIMTKASMTNAMLVYSAI